MTGVQFVELCKRSSVGHDSFLVFESQRAGGGCVVPLPARMAVGVPLFFVPSLLAMLCMEMLLAVQLGFELPSFILDITSLWGWVSLLCSLCWHIPSPGATSLS